MKKVLKIGLVLCLITYIIDMLYDVRYLEYFYSGYLYVVIILAFVNYFKKTGVVNGSKYMLIRFLRKLILIFISLVLFFLLFYKFR